MSGAPQSCGLSYTPRFLDSPELQDQQVRHSNATKERCLIVQRSSVFQFGISLLS
jgi:hypothetical protein